MNSLLGSNLSELDRLLLELNAVQQSAPAFPTEGTRCFTISNINASSLQRTVHKGNECARFVTEEAAPPLPSSSIIHQIHENGVSSAGTTAPAALQKPKRGAAGRVIEDARPSVESLLDELEISVPSPM